MWTVEIIDVRDLESFSVVIKCELYVLVGTFQSAGVIQSAYNLNNELHVFPISAPTDCPHDSCTFVTVSSSAVIVAALKQVPVAAFAVFTVFISV